VKEWKKGERHPDTPEIFYRNLRDYDHVRRILLGRCKKCDQVISSDENAIKELVFECGDPKCCCRVGVFTTRVHRVCDVCYTIWHSLYMNTGLKSMNYFKELDEKDGASGGKEKRRRMGLD
jgi:hypothetical protein